jgi:type IV secretion system protein VirB9
MRNLIISASLLALGGCTSQHLAECKGPEFGLNGQGVSPAVWDDGQSTMIRLLGNSRIPSVYVVGPDGKEAVANYSVSGDLITVHQVAPQLRLRDGDAVLCLTNNAFNPVGVNYATGTTSPDVVRVPKNAAR